MRPEQLFFIYSVPQTGTASLPTFNKQIFMVHSDPDILYYT